MIPEIVSLTEHPRIALSAEGIDEEIIKQMIFHITKTSGGKFRVYNEGTAMPKAFDTEEEAKKALALQMTLIGNMTINPEKTIDIILKTLKEK